MKPVVAIIGRPNVGKSTLFNRITRTQDALVSDFPGLTRDRHYGIAQWNDREFAVVDTGGYIEDDADEFAEGIRFQIRQAMESADAILFVLDGRTGITPHDPDLVRMMRAVHKPVFCVVNKIDGAEAEDALIEFYKLGLETLYPVSAAHGYGVPDLLDDLVKAIPETPEENEGDRIGVAFVGRPNVGKSSLINRIIGENRLLISDIPGTTRDSIDTSYRLKGKDYLLIDTAGIRRKSKVSEKIEKFSILQSLRSLDRCDVALIMLDAGEGVTDQDIRIAGYASERGCGCVFLINKWDLAPKDTGTLKRYTEDLREAAKFLSFAPLLTVSALTGQRISRIFNLVDQVHAQYTTRIPTGQLNKIIENAVSRNEPPYHRGSRLRFYYATQIGVGPPSIVCFVNHPEAVHFSYHRYLLNRLREETGLTQTPIRLMFHERSGRIDFSGKKRKRAKTTRNTKRKK